ncbi:P-loop containing nucleoside triphosphate hydrolase protein [Hygrophoropsis aurantiaca]|uniref:P-loop containing nucleoside triphosphate hydrolase protein n=1 Tax=Hygrophoropsis aurantiaca TaxID=72124 RepID=A0ACB8AFT0_9AGAM|nr:P-loop containing nucleoside triphosphate hydrolase protein [Hygrophoropsis aurantiaca]
MPMGRNKSRKATVPLKSKLKKDPGVPRLPDLKVRNAEKQKSHPPSQIANSDGDAIMASEPTLSSLAMLASSSQGLDVMDPSSSAEPSQKTKEQMRRHYVRTLHKVIDESDIVVLVLDARDPEGCRSRLVEEEVRRRESEGKKLVFVLNKIDLVPRENAQQWLRYLRHSTPTLPFRSASSNQRSNLSSSTAPGLLRLLKAYKPSSAQSVTVGVVGFPNVGKSSLINSLKRSKVCAVAAQPGHTKDLQSIQLERGIKIVDSPGVVFDEEGDDAGVSAQMKGSILLRNVVKVEDVNDPIAVVEEILARTEHHTLQKIYNLPDFQSTLEFLTMLALSSGRLLKGGTPDILSAARHVLMDWNHQKIPYFSVPPVIHPSSIPSTIPGMGETLIAPGAETVGQAQILIEFSKPFELAGLFGAADAGAFGESISAAEEVIMEDETAVQESFQEPDLMAEDEPVTRLAHKRPRSPSISGDPQSSNQHQASAPSFSRAPKRIRRAKDLSAYEEAAAWSNPMSRKVLKQDAKKARRAANKLHKTSLQKTSSGMEVDELQFTFIAGVNGAT